jgi:hypothetical protein
MALSEIGVLMHNPLKSVDVAVDPNSFLVDLPRSLQVVRQRDGDSAQQQQG